MSAIFAFESNLSVTHELFLLLLHSSILSLELLLSHFIRYIITWKKSLTDFCQILGLLWIKSGAASVSHLIFDFVCKAAVNI